MEYADLMVLVALVIMAIIVKDVVLVELRERRDSIKQHQLFLKELGKTVNKED